MTSYDENVSPGFVHPFRHNDIYNTSIATSASASTASVWSDASSQSSDISSQTSDDGSFSGTSSDGESCDSYCGATTKQPARVPAQQLPQPAPVPAELRKNPRRTAAGASSRPCPPTLFRQEDRKNSFVDNLVDSSTQIVEAIWPTSSTICRNETGRRDVLPLRMFIQETLRRSRTSYSTLQVALYYLVLIKPRIPSQNFTTEQVDDRLSTQALQCGRRMFLAALILASKYLQDRNYSARAWSKISGLNTHEINQNEMAFLYAVNWKLHICDDVFRRWTDIVLKHTPPSVPPSPGAATSPLVISQQESWRHIILGLDTELTNIEKLTSTSKSAVSPKPRRGSQVAPWPRALLNSVTPHDARPVQSCPDVAAAKTYAAPMVMEPTPTSAYTPGRWAPSLTLLPTPRLTPRVSGGLCTPAAGAAVPPPTASRRGSMCMAMSQASNVTASQYLDRPPPSLASSPQSFCPARRSSLANSVSTTSSPESMVSDMSRSSRSSSISSASSLASATVHSKMSASSRFRGAKPSVSERLRLKPTVPSVPEDYGEHVIFRSPSPTDSYTGPVGRPAGYSSAAGRSRPLAGRKRHVDDMATDPASDAARALQDLHDYGGYVDATAAAAAAAAASKYPYENLPLQHDVRDLLRGACTPWPNTLVRSRGFVSDSNLQHQRKRVCCATEATNGFEAASASQPGLGLRGPGMWQSILN
ncbi:hypothetical protein GMORB2_5259 [Geosmithia morbida]|uniref:Uncharacterized protein n=1 Tax=Geosmithia morbida TaxID=1094350 RepID=A0A9P5D239_9HYPO|nr:uncharacterized protein GMORB2_5259 [Geosmithia morbida]KAF4124593.1 hypothetical protein GMORB2_5259 [Geosmithia morbida]